MDYLLESSEIIFTTALDKASSGSIASNECLCPIQRRNVQARRACTILWRGNLCFLVKAAT